MIVPWSNHEATIFGQVVGVLIVGLFVFSLSLALWAALKYTIGIRADALHERSGLDRAELGLEAYPEFVTR